MTIFKVIIGIPRRIVDAFLELFQLVFLAHRQQARLLSPGFFACVHDGPGGDERMRGWQEEAQ